MSRDVRRAGLAVPVLVFLSLCGLARATNYTAVVSGSWSEPATWTPAGGPPRTTDQATIPAGRSVAMDAAAAGSAAALTVTGAGAKLTLATNLTVTGNSAADLGAGLDLGGFTLSAANFYMDDAGTSVTRAEGGRLKVSGTLYVREDAELTLGVSDVVANSQVITDQNGGGKTTVLTTASSSNVTGNVSVGAGTPLNYETLILGADLNLAGGLNLNAAYADGGTVRMQGHNLTANSIWIYMSTPITDRALGGKITINSYTGVRGAVLLCRAGDLIRQAVNLNIQYNAGADLQVDQYAGETTGLTLGSSANPASTLTFQDDYKRGSYLRLNFGADYSPAVRD